MEENKMKAYSIGVDFGTLSGRAVLVRHADGAEIAASTYTYPHAVMDRTLPDGTVLPPDFMTGTANTSDFRHVQQISNKRKCKAAAEKNFQ